MRIYTQLGTRIHTHNLGRVSIHTTWDAYLHTQSWDAYPFIQKIHNHHKKIIRMHRNFTKSYTNHKDSQKSYNFSWDAYPFLQKIHNHSQKNHIFTTNPGSGHKEIKKIHIYIYIYIYKEKNSKIFNHFNKPHPPRSFNQK